MKELDADDRLHFPKKEDGRIMKKVYLHELEGQPMTDIWADIKLLSAHDQERLGYPTQKPEALLERIINASSNEGDVVLDPFCGCGTTINVAERLKRRWIGIDITHLAVALIRSRLNDTFGTELSPYEVHGTPTDTASAEALALQDRYQFQWWALSLIDARPAQDKKKGKDTGIDGYIRYLEREGEPSKTVIVQVKSGKVSSRDIRDLVGVLDREKAVIGVFITLQPPTRDMTKEAVSAGFYQSQWGNFPRLQILTIEDLLTGKTTAQYPRLNAATFKRATRQRRTQGEQGGLF
jgi:site-specific DNA-methyltransferase (adenine-specific)